MSDHPSDADSRLDTPSDHQIPLVVDLDGTLVHTDMLHESTMSLLRQSPRHTLHLPRWLYEGKASLKQSIASRTNFRPELLPYNQELVEWLRSVRASGRRLVLCTASDQQIAAPIAEHLQLFDDVMASDGMTNLAGRRKSDALVERFGERAFDYAGNSSADLRVWEKARRAIVVNANGRLVDQAAELAEVERVFSAPESGVAQWRRALRLHQWLKNLLLFVPLLASHRLGDTSLIAQLLLAFLSYGLCASAVYLANDLLDLESDRMHPRKRFRPFAAGTLRVSHGVIASLTLFGLSFLLAMTVSWPFVMVLGVYFVVTTAYSFRFKQVLLLDCVLLAMLYTLRVIAGSAATGIGLSFWMLAFSGFLFLSLAFVKRYAEMEQQKGTGKKEVHGRGYRVSDRPLVQSMGVASGYCAVLVLALYLNSHEILALYRTPAVMWAAVPVVLFWISWIWMKAHRGEMHDDPVIFAVTDRVSQMAGVAFAIVMLVGATGLPGIG